MSQTKVKKRTGGNGLVPVAAPTPKPRAKFYVFSPGQFDQVIQTAISHAVIGRDAMPAREPMPPAGNGSYGMPPTVPEKADPKLSSRDGIDVVVKSSAHLEERLRRLLGIAQGSEPLGNPAPVQVVSSAPSAADPGINRQLAISIGFLDGSHRLVQDLANYLGIYA